MQEMEFLHIYVLLRVPEYFVDGTCSFYRFRVYLSSVFRRVSGKTVKLLFSFWQISDMKYTEI